MKTNNPYIKKLRQGAYKRKQYIKALVESEKKYRHIFEYTGSSMLLIEESGIISKVNPQFERISGFSNEDIAGKMHWMEFIQPKDVKPMEEFFKRHLINREDTGMGFMLLTKQGAPREVLSNISLISDTQCVISLIDITEHKKAEKALRDSKERNLLLLDSIEDGFYEVDMAGNLIYANEALARIFGINERQSHIGLNYRNYMDEENASIVFQTFSKVFNSGNPEKGLIWDFNKNDGTKRTVEVSISPVRDSDGKISGFRGTLRDITERKQSEERLKYLSMHDMMTGLYNRTYFEEEMSRIKKGRFSPVAIICCDVDNLKLVNDTLGHKKGDDLLKSVARILKKPFRASDVVARTGGDEFCVILPHTDEATTQRICERIQYAVDIHNKDTKNLPIGLSMGMATGVINKKTSCDDLYKQADNHMYQQKLQNRARSTSTLVKTIIKNLDEKDFIAVGHAERLYILAEKFIGKINLGERELQFIKLLDHYHDIGKAAISDDIIFKPGPLSKTEWEEIKRHSEIGYRIAKSSPHLSSLANLILLHHECWNGKGYPQGLKGQEIPLLCRIFAITDAYDTMTTDRPYRKTISSEEALAEIKRCAGSQFDPDLVKLFILAMSD